MLDVDCDIVAGDWDPEFDWEGFTLAAVSAAFAGAGHGAVAEGHGAQIEVSVRLSDDEEVRRLNRDYRGKDKTTNILSFPMLEADDVGAALARTDMDILLGDLALAFETTSREADEKNIPCVDHLAHLLIHGTLHLLGHDHVDDAAADAMEALETRILAGLGISDPYADARVAVAASEAVDDKS